jgi:hypothetical protein
VPPDPLGRCQTVRDVARRWRTRPENVRALIRNGTLSAILLNGRHRITPEAIAAAEAGPLAVQPVRRRRREFIPAEVLRLLET